MDKLALAATFDAAADYIQGHGWVVGRTGVDGGPRCGMGALRSVAGLSDTATEEGPSARAYHEAAGYFVRLTGIEIPTFNDHFCASGAEMMEQFRDIAGLLRLEVENSTREALETKLGIDRDLWNLSMGLFQAATFAQYDADAAELTSRAIALEKLDKVEALS